MSTFTLFSIWLLPFMYLSLPFTLYKRIFSLFFTILLFYFINIFYLIHVTLIVYLPLHVYEKKISFSFILCNYLLKYQIVDRYSIPIYLIQYLT